MRKYLNRITKRRLTLARSAGKTASGLGAVGESPWNRPTPLEARHDARQHSHWPRPLLDPTILID